MANAIWKTYNGKFRRGVLFACYLIQASDGQSWSIPLTDCNVSGVYSLVTQPCYGNGDFRLHCILRDDSKPVLVNIKWKWISRGHCPYYDRALGKIDQFQCVGNQCPYDVGERYQSFQVYKYIGCLQAPYLTTKPTNRTKPTDGINASVFEKVTYQSRSTVTSQSLMSPDQPINVAQHRHVSFWAVAGALIVLSATVF